MPRARRSSSVTTSEVMRRSSIMARPRAASSSAAIGVRIGFHRLPRVQGERIGPAALQQAAEIAIGDEAEEAALCIEHRGNTELLARHLVDHLAHRSGGRDGRQRVAGVHQIADEGKFFTKFAARVERSEIFRTEAFAQRDGDRQRIAESEHGRSRCGGRKPEAAGFVWHGAIERDITGARECGVQVAAKGDECVADALERSQQAQDLLGFAGGREREHQVAPGKHPKVAVQRLRRMQEERRCPGRGECGGDLLRDDAAFAHTGDDHAAARLTATEHQFDGGGEGPGHGAFETGGERRDEALRLGADQVCGRRRGIGWCGIGWSGHDSFLPVYE